MMTVTPRTAVSKKNGFILKGTVSRFGACPYYIFACARFIARPAFSLFMNQSEASCLISHANSHEIINRGINPTGQN